MAVLSFLNPDVHSCLALAKALAVQSMHVALCTSSQGLVKDSDIKATLIADCREGV